MNIESILSFLSQFYCSDFLPNSKLLFFCTSILELIWPLWKPRCCPHIIPDNWLDFDFASNVLVLLWLGKDLVPCGLDGVGDLNGALSPQAHALESLLANQHLFANGGGEGDTGCSGKNVFFKNSMQPLPLPHRFKRPSRLSTQCECIVTPIGW